MGKDRQLAGLDEDSNKGESEQIGLQPFAATGIAQPWNARISRSLSLYSASRRGSFDDALTRGKPVWPGEWLKMNGSVINDK